MTRWQYVKIYAPSIVLFCWATWWALVGRTLVIDFLWLAALVLATLLHTNEEVRRWRARGRHDDESEPPSRRLPSSPE